MIDYQNKFSCDKKLFFFKVGGLGELEKLPNGSRLNKDWKTLICAN